MVEKKVDEEWKKQASKERDDLAQKPSEKEAFLKADLATFLSGLASQVLVGLGEVENPVSGKKEKNLNQAKYTIDLLQVLKEKMAGNLTEVEEKYLDGMLYDLRMRYVEASH